MSSKRLIIVCWFLLLTSLHYGQCCGPAEIGQHYTITSTDNVPPGATVEWLLNFGTEYVTLYSDSHLNVYPRLYAGTRNSLTILNVTKDNGREAFIQVVNGKFGYKCTLPVYKRASTPACEPLTLTENQIRTKCTTVEVYPQAKCQFTLQNGETERRIITDGTAYIAYTHTDPHPDENEYNSTSCTLEYPVDGLKPGDWGVQVNMYPHLTGVSLAQGAIGQADNSVPWYGPEKVTIFLADNQLREIPNEPLNLCSSEGLDVIVICAVKQDDVYNELTLHDFTMTKPNTVNMKENYLDRSDGDYKSVNKLKINSGGNHTLICEVRNPKISDIKQTKSMTVQVKTDPKKADENTGPFTTAELAGGIVGAIIGTFMLVAVIALVVFILRREKGKRRNRTEDKEYDKIKRQAPLPYQNVKPRDTTYQEMDSSDQAPNSASVNQENDRTYRNQAYGDYEEPIELDTNAYSDIQTN